MGKSRGFTLIELMVTIAVLAIITAMAVPAFKDMMLAQNFNKSTQGLIATLNEARAQAVLTRTQVEIRMGVDVTSLTTDDKKLFDQKQLFLWNPSGEANLKSGSLNSIYFNLSGGICALDGSTPPKCVPVSSDTSVEVCNKTTGNDKKSKIVSISKMGTIQQTTEGTC